MDVFSWLGVGSTESRPNLSKLIDDFLICTASCLIDHTTFLHTRDIPVSLVSFATVLPL